MSILKTKDYDSFKILPENRAINEFNVKKIMESISSKNMLEDKPIMVDRQMNIFDGRHRLEAAKRLNLEIYYKINENLKSSDIILLNANQKSWQLNDYLNYYCKKQYADYVLLEEFCQANGLSLMHFRALLNNNELFSEKFRCGKFQFPVNESYTHFSQRLSDVRDIQDYIEKKLPDTRICYKGSHFLNALITFINNKQVDVGVFKGKLEIKLDVLRPSTNRSGYISMFKTIYNWKNANPVDVD